MEEGRRDDLTRLESFRNVVQKAIRDEACRAFPSTKVWDDIRCVICLWFERACPRDGGQVRLQGNIYDQLYKLERDLELDDSISRLSRNLSGTLKSES
jgi:hypothetical protein